MQKPQNVICTLNYGIRSAMTRILSNKRHRELLPELVRSHLYCVPVTAYQRLAGGIGYPSLITCFFHTEDSAKSCGRESLDDDPELYETDTNGQQDDGVGWK
jgi:hypothetical protein